MNMNSYLHSDGGGIYFPPRVWVVQLRPRTVLLGSLGSTEKYDTGSVWEGDDID